MSKRILWLLHHSRRRDFEVPMLMALGYEVFTPKRITAGYGDWNESVTWEYDAALSLPKDTFDTLNASSFSEGISPEIMEILNQFFDLVFCPLLLPPLRDLARSFRGTLVLRVHQRPEDFPSVTAALQRFSGRIPFGGCGLLPLLDRMSGRFWFAPASETLCEKESEFLKRRAVILPAGLTDTEVHPAENPMASRLLYFCPGIRTEEKAARRYQSFRENFRGIPQLISGYQLQPVPDDPNVLGLEKGAEAVFAEAAVVYDDRPSMGEIRDEITDAIRRGIPVLYTPDSFLGKFAGPDEPGLCKSLRQAKQGILRILRHDAPWGRRIADSQAAFLRRLDAQALSGAWGNGLARITLDAGKALPSARRRVGLVLFPCFSEERLAFSMQFAQQLIRQLGDLRNPAELVFLFPDPNLPPEDPEDDGDDKKDSNGKKTNHPKKKSESTRKDPREREKTISESGKSSDASPGDIRPLDPRLRYADFFSALQDCGIPVRFYRLEAEEKRWVQNSQELAGYYCEGDQRFYPEYVTVIRDHISDLKDCDSLLLLSDDLPSKYPFYTMQPYAAVFHQRDAGRPPESAQVSAMLLSHADFLLAPDPSSETAALQSGLLDATRIHPFSLSDRSLVDQLKLERIL